MAAPRYPYWLQEMSPAYRGPRMATLLLVMLLTLFVVIVVLPRAAADPHGEIARRQACHDLAVQHRMGVTRVNGGSNYRVIADLCHGRPASSP